MPTWGSCPCGGLLPPRSLGKGPLFCIRVDFRSWALFGRALTQQCWCAENADVKSATPLALLYAFPDCHHRHRGGLESEIRIAMLSSDDDITVRTALQKEMMYNTNGKKQKARPKRRKTKSTLVERDSHCDIVVRTAPSALDWCV